MSPALPDGYSSGNGFHLNRCRDRCADKLGATLAAREEATLPETRHPSPQPSQTEAPAGNERRRWIEPAVEELPRLTDLTLQTGDPIGGRGGTGGGGSVVF